MKNRRIVVDLRRDVLRGVFAPGTRLPARTDLLKRFGVSSATLQVAMDQLCAEGLLYVDGKQGTFVAAEPPNLHDVALVAVPGIDQSLFDQVLLSAAGELGTRHGLTIQAYSIDKSRRNSPDAERLMQDVLQRRFSAMILTDVSTFQNSPILTEPGIDRVSVGGIDEEAANLPRVRLDVPSLARRAIEYLRSRGRTRIAHVGFVSQALSLEKFTARLKQWQPDVRPFWLQMIPECDSQMRSVVGNMVSTLMHLEREHRPDGLIIHDDNLIEHAVAGLLSAGVAVPRDVEVVAHTNFPLLAKSTLPLKRLGFDCGVVMEQCLQLIEQLRSGKRAIEPPPLGVVFDDEITPIERPSSDIAAETSRRIG